ncbi:MAG: MerR family transcriptional regulator, light-induced transcriptional regulator [Solirubrobacteraceae bacterium]|nr:MerR family transcriptional regulator, light-induced transcriptional regulator [Solirubrobacteraceae bacterium]
MDRSFPHIGVRSTRGRPADRGVSAFARRYADALAVGDAVAADRVVDAALAAAIEPVAIQSLVMAPAMVKIGELLTARRISVDDEQRATSMCERALIRLFDVMIAGSAGVGSRERVLLAAVEGQRHVLGLRMVADVLEAAGYDVVNLGEDVPADELRDIVARDRPAVVGLAVGTAANVRFLADAVWAVHSVAPDTRIMLGGRGVPAAFWDVGYPRVATTMEVVEVVEDLLVAPAQPLPPVVDRLRDPWSDRAQLSLAELV